MAKVKFTHIGILEGCDARTPKDYKREIKLRETKNFWVSEAGNKYRKNGWGVGDWPLYCLKIDSIRPIEQ